MTSTSVVSEKLRCIEPKHGPTRASRGKRTISRPVGGTPLLSLDHLSPQLSGHCPATSRTQGISFNSKIDPWLICGPQLPSRKPHDHLLRLSTCCPRWRLNGIQYAHGHGGIFSANNFRVCRLWSEDMRAGGFRYPICGRRISIRRRHTSI